MYDYIIYTDNSLKYTTSGVDIHNTIEDNLHIIKHICGDKTDILSWEIEENTFKMVKPFIPLALDSGMNGFRGNYDKLLEKQKSSQISITISPDFCL